MSRHGTRDGSICAVLACIVLLSGVLAIRPSTAAQQTPDALYADRESLESAMLAAEAWERRLEDDPLDFDAAWKLSRARYWLGGHVTRADRTSQYEAGIAVARRAALMESARPEGHFWMAANMGALAESSGLRAGLRYRGDIKERLETVLSLDPGYQQGSADRALVCEGARPVWRQRRARRGTPPPLARVRPEQHGVAFLPGGDVPRDGSHRGRQVGTPASARCPVRSRMGTGRSRVQAKGPGAAGAASVEPVS